jgi:hypothetical protein
VRAPSKRPPAGWGGLGHFVNKPSYPAVAFFSTVVVACASTPPPIAEAPPPAPTTPGEAATSTVTERPAVAADPNVIRCGVDESPVPIGEAPRRQPAGEDELPLRVAGADESAKRARRFDRSALRSPLLGFGQVGARLIALPAPPGGRGALSTIEMTTTLAPASPDFDVRRSIETFTACGDFALPDPPAALVDTTTIALTFGPNGAPTTARLPAPLPLSGASKLARCLVERACALHEIPSRARSSGSLHVTTTVEPPVFRGTVEATYTGNDFSHMISLRSRGLDRPSGQAARAIPGSEPVKKLVKEATLTCAKRYPPAQTITFEHAVMLQAEQPQVHPIEGPTREHAAVLSKCLRTELEAQGTARSITQARGTFVFGLVIEPHPGRKTLERMGDPLISEE